MGHMVGKDLYRELGGKIDNLSVRVPWTESFYEVLKELYSDDDADLIIKMPYGFSTIERIAFIGGFLKLPPVKKSLMGDKPRSRFLKAMRKGGHI